MNDELNFEQRHVSGKVSAVFPNYVYVELAQPLNGLRWARVLRGHWLPGHVWHEKERIEHLFVYDLSADAKEDHGRGHWFASALWANHENNPWYRFHDAHPVAGAVVEGEIIQAAGEQSVVLRLVGTELEAFLHLREVPDGRLKSIAELLPLGLKLRAKIIKVDSARCKLELSVLAWLADVERHQGKAPHSIGREFELTPYLRFVDADLLIAPKRATEAKSIAHQSAGPQLGPDPHAPAQRPWVGKGVLVLDDDNRLLIAELSRG